MFVNLVMGVALWVKCWWLVVHYWNLCALTSIPAQNCIKILIESSIFNDIFWVSGSEINGL